MPPFTPKPSDECQTAVLIGGHFLKCDAHVTHLCLPLLQHHPAIPRMSPGAGKCPTAAACLSPDDPLIQPSRRGKIPSGLGRLGEEPIEGVVNMSTCVGAWEDMGRTYCMVQASTAATRAKLPAPISRLSPYCLLADVDRWHPSENPKCSLALADPLRQPRQKDLCLCMGAAGQECPSSSQPL